MDDIKSFKAWQETVFDTLRRDALWDFQAYRKALFLYDLAWKDTKRLLRDTRGKAVAGQLIRSVGSISANTEEGYRRRFGKDYGYRLRIALAEARESRGWYWRARHLLPDDVVDHRMSLLSEIIAMITPNIRRQQNYRRE